MAVHPSHLAGGTGCDWLTPNADCPVIEVIKGRNGKPCPAQHAPAHGRTQTALPGWNGPLETGQVIWPQLATLPMRGIEATRR
jgi:hypothetical protein